MSTLKSYKGFDKDLKCRDFQFEVGKTYTHTGPVVACRSGFHACENPWDVLSYYPFTGSRFCAVEQSGELQKHDDDSKIASASITIMAELKLPEFVKTCVGWLITACKSDASSGYGSKLAASGYGSKLAASGSDSKLAASGNYSKLAASGYDSKLAASGNDSKLAASGDGSKLAASGNYSHLAASGDDSKLAASGYRSQLAASGNDSRLAASGDDSRLAASGDNSLIMGAYGSHAKAGPNGAFAIAWHDGNHPRIAVGYVGEGLRADTWYRVDDAGNFVEVVE